MKIYISQNIIFVKLIFKTQFLLLFFFNKYLKLRNLINIIKIKLNSFNLVIFIKPNF